MRCCHVASSGIEIARGRRTEEIKSAHTKFTTEIVERAPIEIERANPVIPPITYPRAIELATMVLRNNARKLYALP